MLVMEALKNTLNGEWDVWEEQNLDLNTVEGCRENKALILKLVLYDYRTDIPKHSLPTFNYHVIL